MISLFIHSLKSSFIVFFLIKKEKMYLQLDKHWHTENREKTCYCFYKIDPLRFKMHACLASMEKAKQISTAISEISSSSGEFEVKSGNGTYDLQIHWL